MSYKIKYKMAVQKLLSISSEIDLIQEAIKNAQFGTVLAKFCMENNISLKGESPKSIPECRVIINSNLPKLQEQKTKETEKNDKKNPLAKIYKKIAKLTHPDLFTREDEETYAEKEDIFKRATKALEDDDWATLLNIADELGVEPDDYRLLVRHIKVKVKKLQSVSLDKKNTYGYLYYDCDDDECREALVKKYLKIHFNIEFT